MGSHQGPEVEALRSALTKAKQAAEERPLEVQLAQTDAFIERSRFRIQKLVQERDAETELLNATLQRQSRLREQIATAESVVPPRAPVPDSSGELVRLRAKVAQLEANLSKGRLDVVTMEVSPAVQSNLKAEVEQLQMRVTQLQVHNEELLSASGPKSVWPKSVG